DALADASSDGSTACPNPDNPIGAKITCHMIAFITLAGVPAASIVVDGSVLLAPGAEAPLLAAGFVEAPAAAGYRAIYELSHPTRGRTARALRERRERSVALVCFSARRISADDPPRRQRSGPRQHRHADPLDRL